MWMLKTCYWKLFFKKLLKNLYWFLWATLFHLFCRQVSYWSGKQRSYFIAFQLYTVNHIHGCFCKIFNANI